MLDTPNPKHLPESVLKTVWSLWKRNGRHCKKVSVSIGMPGVKVHERYALFGQSATSYIYPLRQVSYCMANKELCGVFAWLESACGMRAGGGSGTGTRCHAVVCDSSATARSMATLLTDCCTVVRNEMLSKARRMERQKELEKRLVTERMRINTTGYDMNGLREDEDDWGFTLRTRPLQGGLIDDDEVDSPHPGDTAKLKCMRVGEIQYTETQMDDKPMLIVESMFSWPVETGSS